MVSQIDPADEQRFLTEENVYYDTVPRGFISFGEFMQSAGLIKEVPGSWKDLVYPNLKNADGS